MCIKTYLSCCRKDRGILTIRGSECRLSNAAGRPLALTKKLIRTAHKDSYCCLVSSIRATSGLLSPPPPNFLDVYKPTFKALTPKIREPWWYMCAL